MKITNNVSELSIMKAYCKTCPFKLNEKNIWQNVTLANSVIERNLFKSQQICHGSESINRKANNRCKGYYDYAFELYNRLGLKPSKNLI